MVDVPVGPGAARNTGYPTLHHVRNIRSRDPLIMPMHLLYCSLTATCSYCSMTFYIRDMNDVLWDLVLTYRILHDSVTDVLTYRMIS